ncbi:MAG TPA: B-box zinc finger protein [Symbiobacteriaceae bacterium]|nr:B-box zinc finger protein [Symbiobacteriaceae bacterium]
MYCATHPTTEATGVCQSCGRPVCADCTIVSGGQTYCMPCGMKNQPRPSVTTNGFFRLILSACPGLGHLYLGMFQRGLQIFLGMLASVIVVTTVMDDGFVALIVFGWIFFSIFDAREIALRQAAGQPVTDQPLVEIGHLWRKRDTIAYGLIGLGILGLYRMVNEIIFRFLDPALSRSFHYLVFGSAAIVAGLYLLRSSRKSA